MFTKWYIVKWLHIMYRSPFCSSVFVASFIRTCQAAISTNTGGLLCGLPYRTRLNLIAYIFNPAIERQTFSRSNLRIAFWGSYLSSNLYLSSAYRLYMLLLYCHRVDYLYLLVSVTLVFTATWYLSLNLSTWQSVNISYFI